MRHREAHRTTPVIRSLVRDAKIEVIPVNGFETKLVELPPTATVTITCSPKFGLERTLAAVETASAAGFDVVPHIAARQVTDEVELKELVRRLDVAQVPNLYVIAGDAPEPAGIFASSAELLDALGQIDHSLTSIGVACYPEGHQSITDAVLADALAAKQPSADYMVSQLCFDVDALVGWLRAARSAGITLPLHLGLAAPMQIHKLAELSLKIGVGSSLRYLRKQNGLIGSLLTGSAYRPEQLLLDLGDELASPELNIERLHLFSFNQVTATAAWQEQISPRQ